MKSFVLLPLFFAVTALSQTNPPAKANWPQVHPDRTVTFLLQAPKASEVTLSGDWMGANGPEKMARDSNGIWSVTVGPLDSGTSIYSFTVDGIAMADPINPRLKIRAQTSASLVEVPGDPSEPWQPRDVPHGTIEINWEKSKVLGEMRAYHVYTPPGYHRKSSARYPVLYLLHGNNDTPAGWTDVGKVHFILDNLIAEKKAAPMIVVMPFGHATPYGLPQANNTALFERYLLEDVIPQVERKYRVDRRRDRRAIVGMSMGGGQAIEIGFGHPDLFGAIGAFSTAVPRDFESRFKPLLDHPAQTNAKLKVLWIGCGEQDPAFDRNRKFSELLTAHKIQNTFRGGPGRHNYALWRRHLVEVMPLLFRR